MTIGQQANDSRRHRGFVDRLGWVFVALVIIAGVAAMTFRRVDISLDPDDGSITAIESKWWGIQKREHRLRWVPPSGSRSGGWMTKNERGELYRYFESDNRSE